MKVFQFTVLLLIHFGADKLLTVHDGGVCLYFKEGLPIERRVDLEFLRETIVAEISQKKLIKRSSISYRQPIIRGI